MPLNVFCQYSFCDDEDVWLVNCYFLLQKGLDFRLEPHSTVFGFGAFYGFLGVD